MSFMVFSKKKQSDISLWLRDEGFSEAVVEAFEGSGLIFSTSYS